MRWHTDEVIKHEMGRNFDVTDEFQWFFIALSVRPGSTLAISAHRFPNLWWASRMLRSSLSVHGALLICGFRWLCLMWLRSNSRVSIFAFNASVGENTPAFSTLLSNTPGKMWCNQWPPLSTILTDEIKHFRILLRYRCWVSGNVEWVKWVSGNVEWVKWRHTSSVHGPFTSWIPSLVRSSPSGGEQSLSCWRCNRWSFETLK